MSFDVKQRQKSKIRVQQATTSIYQKASLFVRRHSDADSSNSSIGLTPSTSNDMNLINKSHRGSDSVTPDHMMEGYSSDSSSSECNFLGGEVDYSFPALFPALELIRELSFSPSRPPHEKKKRANTADTETSFSSSEISLEREVHRHRRNTISIDLDVKHSPDLRERPSSPLLGLQYLPDHGISSYDSDES